MTLIIAQRLKEKVSFSSDSRLTLREGVYFDLGIKVFNVPFRLKGLLKSFEDRDKWEFESQYGMAIIGSSMNAYTVKESISEVLAHLQYPTNAADISIIGIGHMILQVYADISKQLSALLREVGFSEILIGGYCLVQQRVRVLRFFSTVEKEEVKYSFEEILRDDGILFFGSGKKLAEKIYFENQELQPLQILRHAVQSGKDKSIGGSLQYGMFVNQNFNITGVSDKIVDSENNTINIKHYLRGMNFEQDIKTLSKYPMLYVAYGYMPIDPFEPSNKEKVDKAE